MAMQKQPSRGVLGKKVFLKYAANLQENAHVLQFYWNRTSAWVLSCKFAAYFQNTFYYEHI